MGGCNCQIAVDDKHKLVVTEDVVQDGNDSCRLTRRGSPCMKEGRRCFSHGLLAAVCRDCSLSHRCLAKGNSSRRIHRWEHEDVIDRPRRKMSGDASLVRQRAALVEHPFGTLKRWAGMDHFLMRGLDKCRDEFSLMTLGYNFKRVMNELGADTFREHCLQKTVDWGDGCNIAPGAAFSPHSARLQGGDLVPVHAKQAICHISCSLAVAADPDTDTVVRKKRKSSVKS